jgi:very-short-patch-repair endonuclease
VTLLDGLRVTTIERTAIDCARGQSLRDALMILDSAARLLAADMGHGERARRDSSAARNDANDCARGRLSEVLAFELAWPGTAVVRDAIRHLDAASESPLESWSRGLIIESGLLSPEVAFAVQGASGRQYFADLAWPGLRVLGEADGTAKYGRSPEEVTRAVRLERRRQRDLEDAGWTVVRWDSTESPAVIIARLRNALLQASRRHGRK